MPRIIKSAKKIIKTDESNYHSKNKSKNKTENKKYYTYKEKK